MDFTKTILIFLVVFGHAITYLQDGSACARALYNGIYSFHMPLFVILSGYFSKNVTTHRRKDIELLLYPYIIFQLLWVLFLNVYKSPHVSWDYNLFVPVRQNWYLLALFIWRWTLPYCQMFKKWAVLSIAIILAVYVGYFPVFNEFNSLHRIFYFFPFFLLGYYMPDIDRVQKKMGKWKYVMPAIFLLSMVCVSILSFSGKGHQILGIAYFPRVCYLTFSHLLIRMAGFASSIIIALSFLSTLQMVKINKAASWIGGGTILVFLMHEFLLLPLRDNLSAMPYWLVLGICFAASVVICYVFSRKRVMKWFAPLLDMRVIEEKLKLKRDYE